MAVVRRWLFWWLDLACFLGALLSFVVCGFDFGVCSVLVSGGFWCVFCGFVINLVARRRLFANYVIDCGY